MCMAIVPRAGLRSAWAFLRRECQASSLGSWFNSIGGGRGTRRRNACAVLSGALMALA